MFGSLFRRQKNPKGPNLKRMESFKLDLSGNQLTFSVPPGNWNQLPDPQGEILPQTNLYDAEQFDKDEETDWYSIRAIFIRDFIYSSFNYPRIGSFQLMVMINKLDVLGSNLFAPQVFKGVVQKQVEFFCQQFNNEIDDEFLRILPPTNYQFTHVGNENFLTYVTDHQLKPYPYYAIALTEGHYITFGFRYLSVGEGDEPWYLMARKLEKQIMESVKLELTESLQQEREAANG